MSDAYGMDIRTPIGLMFAIIGVILAGYGVFTMGSEIYDQHSLGINVNLWWGLVLLLFGVIMLALTFKGSKSKAPEV